MYANKGGIAKGTYWRVIDMMTKQTLDYYRAYFAREEGATATEYIVLLVFIALAIIVAVTFLGTQLSGAFNSAGNRILPGGGGTT